MQMGSCTSSFHGNGDCWISNKTINPNEVDLSHFKVVAVIGLGGFSKVFQAVNRLTGESVAIKVMDKAKAANSKTLFKSIWSERNIMSSLCNVFILPLIHSFQTFYECYLVVPFMEGSDLTHFSRSHFFLNEDQVRFYFCQLLVALEYLHSNQIVHRDVKPRNALLEASGNMRLCDFGLAHKFKNENEFLKNTAGTDSYNAPEMLARLPYRFSVDVWSLGISLYELLYQKRPFRSDKHMCDAHEKNQKLNFSSKSSISPMVRDLISKMLEWNVEKRIGCGKEGISEIKKHSWLASIDWEKVKKRELVPPFLPKEEAEGTMMVDANVFNTKKKEVDSYQLNGEVQKKFNGFEFAVTTSDNLPKSTFKPITKRRSEKRLLKVDLKKTFKESMAPRFNFGNK